MYYDIELIEKETNKTAILDYQMDHMMDIENIKVPNWVWFKEFIDDHLDEGGLEEINEIFTISRKELMDIIIIAYKASNINKTLQQMNIFSIANNKFKIEIKKNPIRYETWIKTNKL